MDGEKKIDGRIGQKFWQARSSHGRKPMFATAEDLWNACVEYFEWVEANPLLEPKLIVFQGAHKIVDVPKLRAMTLKGLCTFLDVSYMAWTNWKRDREDLAETIARVEQIIFTQKVEGAAADLFNANIVIRELGLADKKVNEHTGPDGEPLSLGELKLKASSNMTKPEYERAMKEIYGNDETNIPAFEESADEDADGDQEDSEDDY